MMAEAEIVCPPNLDALLSSSHLDIKTPADVSDDTMLQFVPSIRSGSFADIGPRTLMEDKHIRIDDLSMHLGSLFDYPTPTAFYAVFDGHGGPEAATYLRNNAIRIFFKDTNFSTSFSRLEGINLQGIGNCFRKAFLLADLALANDSAIRSSSGATALTAFVLGRLLLVANAGDCRAVLCRRGEALDMSQDHKPTHYSERRRVEQSGGSIDDDGYLNGVLSVTRALGDWDMKLPNCTASASASASASPLIADPELRQIILTDDDEFLIIGCDGVWDVMSSQQAVSVVRRGLRRHDDPEQSAKDLVREALRLQTFDNLTVIVVCFSSLDRREEEIQGGVRQRRFKCSLSAEALSRLRNLLDGNGNHSDVL